ncbi:hypothetical protein BC826DRAFT_692722 [Russula brevipes]|nr:hypothetical protein BC826DRAFT_692722 [Russula brevipes]
MAHEARGHGVASQDDAPHQRRTCPITMLHSCGQGEPHQRPCVQSGTSPRLLVVAGWGSHPLAGACKQLRHQGPAPPEGPGSGPGKGSVPAAPPPRPPPSVRSEILGSGAVREKEGEEALVSEQAMEMEGSAVAVMDHGRVRSPLVHMRGCHRLGRRGQLAGTGPSKLFMGFRVAPSC